MTNAEMSVCFNKQASILLFKKDLCVGGLDAFPIDDYWYLSRLIVKKEIRGEGWGRRMIEWLQSKVDCIVVHPGGYDLDYDEIISFYKHMGFKETNLGFVWNLVNN